MDLIQTDLLSPESRAVTAARTSLPLLAPRLSLSSSGFLHPSSNWATCGSGGGGGGDGDGDGGGDIGIDKMRHASYAGAGGWQAAWPSPCFETARSAWLPLAAGTRVGEGCGHPAAELNAGKEGTSAQAVRSLRKAGSRSCRLTRF